MTMPAAARLRIFSAVLAGVVLAGGSARGAPPEESPATISFSESLIPFPATTSVAAKACWGAYIVYVDVGPTAPILVYHEYREFVQVVVAYPSPGFFALAGAATDRGVVFVGLNVLSRKTQIARLDLGPLR